MGFIENFVIFFYIVCFPYNILLLVFKSVHGVIFGRRIVNIFKILTNPIAPHMYSLGTNSLGNPLGSPLGNPLGNPLAAFPWTWDHGGIQPC